MTASARVNVVALGCSVAIAAACAASRVPQLRQPTEIARGGVRALRLSSRLAPPSSALRGGAGDWLLESDRVRLVVGSGGKSLEARFTGGALLDLTTREWLEDGLDDLRPALVIGETERALELVSVEPLDEGPRPALRIRHRDPAFGLELVTELRVEPGRPSVELVSELSNQGSAALRNLRIGDSVRFLRRLAFAPKLGFVHETRHATVDWVGNEARALSYALAAPKESLDVRFRAGLRGPDEQLVLGPRFDLGPLGKRRHRRLLVSVPGGIARAAELAWQISGRPIGYVEGALTQNTSWARLEALTTSGEPMLEVRPSSDGSFRLPLPSGEYRLRAITAGGIDEQRVRVEAPASVSGLRFIVPEPRRLSYRVSSVKGDPLPARLVIRGIAPTKDPELGPPHSAAGAANVTYTIDGQGSVELPPGRYRLLVTHGPEWTVYEEDVDVRNEQGTVLRATLSPALETPGFIACDFHLHAEPSGDSDVPLRDRAIALIAEGIEFAVATDHDHVTDYGPAIAQLPPGPGLGSARGVEITTAAWGHFNAYPLPANATPPVHAELDPGTIFANLRKAAPGALIQVNHPRMGSIGYFAIGGLDAQRGVASLPGFSLDFDAIEILNGFEHEDLTMLEKNLADWYGLLELGRRYTAVGNSDSHQLPFQWAGYPRTYVQLDDDRPAAATAEAISLALRKGRALVSSGPFLEFLVNGARPGELVRAPGRRVKVELTVRAAPWVDVTRARLIVSGRTAWETAIPPIPAEQAQTGPPGGTRLAWSGEIELERDGWIVAIALGARPSSNVLAGWQAPPVAFTNPVFVDVDGDLHPALGDASPSDGSTD